MLRKILNAQELGNTYVGWGKRKLHEGGNHLRVAEMQQVKEIRQRVLGRRDSVDNVPASFLCIPMFASLDKHWGILKSKQLLVILNSSYQLLVSHALSNQLLSSMKHRAHITLINWKKPKTYFYHRSTDDHNLREILVAHKCRVEHLCTEPRAKYFRCIVCSPHSELDALIRFPCR